MEYTVGQYGYDLQQLQQYVTTIELVAGDSRVLLVPEFQGRVMTSTAAGHTGYSFGWVNHALISSEHRSPAFNAFGGEERFWLGPEGGPFSIFFAPGKPMNIKNWIVPAVLDSVPWDINEVMPEMATFSKSFSLQNYSGTQFDLRLTRRVGIIFPGEIPDILNIPMGSSVQAVAYESLNEVKNTGTTSWTKESGLLSVWMLSMYNPSPGTTVVIPFRKDCEDPAIKADYFGEVPADRLKWIGKTVFFRADGRYRSKIGVPPRCAFPLLGSYDSRNRRLTILECLLHPEATDYVNASWEPQQQKPYAGDVINAYNDGPLDDGRQLGPFYEMETSSPALALEPDESKFHLQRTYHFEGREDDLNRISEKLLGVSLRAIKQSF